MQRIVEFFEPVEIQPWLVKIVVLFLASYFFIWIVALILSRISWFAREDAILKIYFGWLTPFTLNTLFAMLLLLFSAVYYKELDISLWYCLPFLLLAVISSMFAFGLIGNISERIEKIENRLEEET